jgi:hypothetical protein
MSCGVPHLLHYFHKQIEGIFSLLYMVVFMTVSGARLMATLLWHKIRIILYIEHMEGMVCLMGGLM